MTRPSLRVLAAAAASVTSALMTFAAPAIAARPAELGEDVHIEAAAMSHPVLEKLLIAGRAFLFGPTLVSEIDSRFALVRITGATGSIDAGRRLVVAVRRTDLRAEPWEAGSWRPIAFGRRIRCERIPPRVRAELRVPCRRLAGAGPTRVEIHRALLQSSTVPEAIRVAVDAAGSAAFGSPRYADLSGDGTPEAIVQITLGAPGASWAYSVVGRIGGQIRMMRVVSPAYQVAVAARRGLLIERRPVFRPGDPTCCPSGVRERRFVWRSGQFVRVV